MSDNDPVSRDGRVSRRPLIIVVLVLVVVAVVGGIASSLARDDNETTVPLAPPTAITSEVPTTEYPTVPPSTVATESGTQAVSADADSCTPDALLTAVRESGEVDPSVAEQASITRFNCVDEYAFTRLSAPGADDAQAYFRDTGDAWEVLVLGTAIDPEAAGVPADTIRQLNTE